MGVGYMAMSRVDGLLAFFFVYVFMIALGNSLGMSTPITASVANWFNRKRGLSLRDHVVRESESAACSCPRLDGWWRHMAGVRRR